MIETQIRVITFSNGDIVYHPERKYTFLGFSWWRPISYTVLFVDEGGECRVADCYDTLQEAEESIDRFLKSKVAKPKRKITKITVINEDFIKYP